MIDERRMLALLSRVNARIAAEEAEEGAEMEAMETLPLPLRLPQETALVTRLELAHAVLGALFERLLTDNVSHQRQHRHGPHGECPGYPPTVLTFSHEELIEMLPHLGFAHRMTTLALEALGAKPEAEEWEGKAPRVRMADPRELSMEPN